MQPEAPAWGARRSRPALTPPDFAPPRPGKGRRIEPPARASGAPAAPNPHPRAHGPHAGGARAGARGAGHEILTSIVGVTRFCVARRIAAGEGLLAGGFPRPRLGVTNRGPPRAPSPITFEFIYHVSCVMCQCVMWRPGGEARQRPPPSPITFEFFFHVSCVMCHVSCAMWRQGERLGSAPPPSPITF